MSAIGGTSKERRKIKLDSSKIENSNLSPEKID